MVALLPRETLARDPEGCARVPNEVAVLVLWYKNQPPKQP